MTTTTIFANIFGILFIIVGLSMFTQKTWNTVAIKELLSSKGVLWLTGFCTILLGATVITLHSNWTYGMPFFISLLGWLTLAKGSLLFLFPEFMDSYYSKVNKETIFSYGGLGMFLLGFYLVLA